MNCLGAFYFWVFLGLLATDAQARILPEISLMKNDLIIVNAGRTSSLLLPPSSIKEISSATSVEKNHEKTVTQTLDSSRSSIFGIIIDIIWVRISSQGKAKNVDDMTATPSSYLQSTPTAAPPPPPPAPSSFIESPIPATPGKQVYGTVTRPPCPPESVIVQPGVSDSENESL